MQLNSNQLSVTVPSTLFEPIFYVFDFSMQPALTKFLIIDEDMLNQSPFLDIRFEPFAHGSFTLASEQIFSLEDQHQLPRPKPVFIFHHAFVCSTLLSRCLNQINAFISLKEPWIYRRLSDLKRAHYSQVKGAKWSEMFIKYTALLCKNYKSGKTPLVKMTNVANNLLEDVCHLLPDSKSLYLYSSLDSFLISNLKKTKETQDKMPELLTSFLRDENFVERHPEWSKVNGLSLLQVCALIWIVNIYNFKQVVERHPKSKIKTLEMDEFLNDMPTALKALTTFYGHDANQAELESMVDPEIVNTNAKDQAQQYSHDNKASEAASIAKMHGSEISQTLDWIKPLATILNYAEFLDGNSLLRQQNK